MAWLRRQQSRPTGLFGMVIDYLAHIRADIIRGYVKDARQISADEHGYLKYGEGDGAEGEQEAALLQEDKAPPGFWDGFPVKVTDEDLAFARKQEMWVSRYGAKKAAEMARQERRRRREAQGEGG